MEENNIKILAYLNAEIENLEETIKNVKNENEIVKLNIRKKELILQKLLLFNENVIEWH